MWLHESLDLIDLKIHKALIKSKQAIMGDVQHQYREQMNINAAGQISIKADLVAEETFVNTLLQEGISGILFSEECGRKEFGEDPFDKNSIILLLDPLDGSQNYSKGLSFGCISVAYGFYTKNPKLKDLTRAMILNLYADETYFAAKGSGAYINGKSISSKLANNGNGQLRSIQISYYDYNSKSSKYSFSFKNTYSMRSLGSAAWELALVANQRNDAYIDIRGVLKAHDFAAALIILEEVKANILFLNLNQYHHYTEIPLGNFTEGYSIIVSRNDLLTKQIMQDIQR